MRGVTYSRLYIPAHQLISTHTPRERRDAGYKQNDQTAAQFQLTRLVRGVTYFYTRSKFIGIFQLTRLVRGVTVLERAMAKIILISTHTPRERRDLIYSTIIYYAIKFQLTRLVRGVT